jgi:hypothetical protein
MSKVSGNMKYLFAMMDDETRFWIAQEVADTKHSHDARGLLQKSRELTGKKPTTFITDGSNHVELLKEDNKYILDIGIDNVSSSLHFVDKNDLNNFLSELKEVLG